MRITIKARNGAHVSDDLKQLVQRRVHFALSRFQNHVARVVVTLDLGMAPSAQVSVRGRTLWHVLVRDEDEWIAPTVSRAMDRARRAVARRLQRQVSRRLAPARSAAPVPSRKLQEVLS